MDDSSNYNDEPTLTQVQNATVTFPVFLSVVGLISVALAVMLYHLILLRYCRHHNYSDQPISSASPIMDETSTMGPGAVSWFGLDDRALKAIPVLPYCERALDFFRIDQSECVVCLGKLERGERVRWLPGCTHAFHVACIDNWLRARASCPTCRTPVVVPPFLLSQFVGGAAYVNGGGMTRARSGGALVRTVKTADSDSLKRSFSVDHSCIVVTEEVSSSSIFSSTSRPTNIVVSKVQDGTHGGVLPIRIVN